MVFAISPGFLPAEADKSTLMAGVASPTSPWGRLETPQETDEEGNQFLGSGAIGALPLDGWVGRG